MPEDGKVTEIDSGEKSKSREVFTDESVVIGKKDDYSSLEAFPLSCAILIVVDKEREVAGMLHVSLGATEQIITDLLCDLKNQLEINESGFEDCTLRLFNAGDIVLSELRGLFETIAKMPVPDSETMPEDGVRINKITGEISFFSPFPDSAESRGNDDDL